MDPKECSNGSKDTMGKRKHAMLNQDQINLESISSETAQKLESLSAQKLAKRREYQAKRRIELRDRAKTREKYRRKNKVNTDNSFSSHLSDNVKNDNCLICNSPKNSISGEHNPFEIENEICTECAKGFKQDSQQINHIIDHQSNINLLSKSLQTGRLINPLMNQQMFVNPFNQENINKLYNQQVKTEINHKINSNPFSTNMHTDRLINPFINQPMCFNPRNDINNYKDHYTSNQLGPLNGNTI
jgi:phosphopantothenoylcysteine synthetase/decarboxylase